jgi:hypothetical protein
MTIEEDTKKLRVWGDQDKKQWYDRIGEVENFKYLGSLVQKDEGFGMDV